jgi:hypothetical protein
MSLVTASVAWTRVNLPRRLSTAFKVLYVLSGFVATPLPLIAGLNVGSTLFAILSIISSVVSLGLIVASYVLSLTEAWHTGPVEVTEQWLCVPTKRKARGVLRSEIVGALYVGRPIAGGTLSTVEIELRNGDRLTVRLDEAAAQGLVAELGFGHGRARVRSRLARPRRRLLHLAIALVLCVALWPLSMLFSMMLDGVAGALASWLDGVTVLLLYTVVIKVTAAPEVEIGDDGVAVWRGRRLRFFRAADPRLGGALRGLDVDQTRVSAVLREASARTRSSYRADRAPQGNEPNLFARAGRSVEDWRRQLVRVMDQSSYRTNGKMTDEAALVLRSPQSTPDQRVGAALALRGVGDPPERVRVAARATADTAVRIALEAVADGADDAVVERALVRAERA